MQWNCIFIDFDDTLFPTTYVRQEQEQHHTIDNNSLLKLEWLLINFVTKCIASTRMFIITHSNFTHIYHMLQYMNSFKNYVDWNYIKILTCDNVSKQTKISNTLKENILFHTYIICGDKHNDILSFKNALKEQKYSHQHTIRTVRFIAQPHIQNLVSEWEWMYNHIYHFMTAQHPVIDKFFCLQKPNRRMLSSSSLHTIVEEDKKTT